MLNSCNCIDVTGSEVGLVGATGVAVVMMGAPVGDSVGDTVGSSEAFKVGPAVGGTEGALVDGAVVLGAPVEGAAVTGASVVATGENVVGENVCGFVKVGAVGELVKDDDVGFETGAVVVATGLMSIAPLFCVG
jgi:hypothetical protein